MEQEQDIIEFFKPRYKVIADYPKCPFNVGQILMQDMNTVGEVFTQDGERFSSNWIDKDTVPNYPHLFKLLEWYEERDTNDMPEYVKDTTEDAVFKPFELKQQFGGRSGMWSGISPDDETDCHWKKNCVPATKEEYLTQNK